MRNPFSAQLTRRSEFAPIHEPELIQAVTTEHFKQVLSYPLRVRSRAQTGFTIASAFVGGLIVAGSISNVQQRATWVVALGMIAVFVWLVAAAAFIYVASGQVTPASYDPEGRDADGKDETPQEVATNVTFASTNARHVLEARLNRALALALLAGLLTLAAASVVAGTGPRVDRTSALVVLNRSDAHVIRELCPSLLPKRRIPAFVGEVAVETLEQPLVNIELTGTRCGGLGVLEIPRSYIDVLETCRTDALAVAPRLSVGPLALPSSKSVTTSTTDTHVPHIPICP